jgi:hypothetical protein
MVWRIVATLLIVAVAAMILGFAMAGCTLIEGSSINGSWAFSETYRYIDDEAGVVCWRSGATGLSCLPISETLLGGE